MNIFGLKLIDEWKSAWKWLSFNCMAAEAAATATWALLDNDLKQSLPHWMLTAITMSLMGLGIFGRITKKDAPAQ